MDVSTWDDHPVELRVQLIGPVRAWRGDTEVDLGSARQRAVFAVLATHTGRVVTKSELVDAVWGEHAPTQAWNSLYTYISRLRRVLHDGAARPVIESIGSGYVLHVRRDLLDVAVFQRLRQSVDEVRHRDGLARACAVIDEALALWRGAPLSGLGGPFAEIQRTHLEELRLGLVELRAGYKLADAHPAEVVADLSGLVRQHPNRESLRCLMMTALYRAGRQADALALYQDTRRHLVEELGVEPGPELRRVHELVLSGESEPEVPRARPWHAGYTPEQLRELREALRAVDAEDADDEDRPDHDEPEGAEVVRLVVQQVPGLRQPNVAEPGERTPAHRRHRRRKSGKDHQRHRVWTDLTAEAG